MAPRWTDNVADAGVASTDPYEARSRRARGGVAEPRRRSRGADGRHAGAAVDDTTASYPTATTPRRPRPYVPADAGAPVEAAGGGGEQARLVIGGAILAAVAIAVVVFLALGG